MNENLKALYTLMPDGAFESEESYNEFIKKNGAESLYQLVPEGAFESIDSFNEFIGSGKKKDSSDSSSSGVSLESIANGDQLSLPDPSKQYSQQLPDSDIGASKSQGQKELKSELQINVDRKLEGDNVGYAVAGQVLKAVPIFGEALSQSSALKSVLNNIGNTSQSIGNSFLLNSAKVKGVMDQISPERIMAAIAESSYEKITGDGAPTDYSESIKEVNKATIETIAKGEEQNRQQSFENKIVRAYDPNATFEENVENAQLGIIKTFQEKGASAGFANLASSVAESTPYIALSVLTGGAAAGASAAGAATVTGAAFFNVGYGSSIIDSYLEDGDVSINDESKALIKGVIEGGASILFGGNSKAIRGMFKGVAKEEAKEIITKTASSRLVSIMKSAGYTGGGEGLEEMAQEGMSFLVDELYAGKTLDTINWGHLMEVSADSFILGAASGGPVGGLKGQMDYMKAKAIVDEEVTSTQSEETTQSTKDNPLKRSFLRSQRKGALEKIYVPEEVDQEDATELRTLYFGVKELNEVIPTLQDQRLRDNASAMKQQKEGRIKEILGMYEGEEEVEQEVEQDGFKPGETVGLNPESTAGSELEGAPKTKIEDTEEYKAITEPLRQSYEEEIALKNENTRTKEVGSSQAVGNQAEPGSTGINGEAGAADGVSGDGGEVDEIRSAQDQSVAISDSGVKITPEIKAEIDTKKENVRKLEQKRDSDSFKFKTFTEMDESGSRKRSKRPKTQEELDVDVRKINSEISTELDAITDLEAKNADGPVDQQALEQVVPTTSTQPTTAPETFAEKDIAQKFDSKPELNSAIKEGKLESGFYATSKGVYAYTKGDKEASKVENVKVIRRKSGNVFYKLKGEKVEPKSREDLDFDIRVTLRKITEGDADSKKKNVFRRIEEASVMNPVTKIMSTIGKSITKLIRPLDKGVSAVLMDAKENAKKYSVDVVTEARSKSIARDIARKVANREDERSIASKGIEEAFLQMSSIANGIVYGFSPNTVTKKSVVDMKRQTKGQKALGKDWGNRMERAFKKHPAYNTQSLKRITSIFDKEAALNNSSLTKEERAELTNLKYEDLTNEEKQLHDYLRAINDYTHEINFAAGLIDEDVYLARKGKYIARLYEEVELKQMEKTVGKGIDRNIYKEAKALYDKATSISDPVYLTMKRFYQTMNNVAVADFANEVSKNKDAHVSKERYDLLHSSEKSKYVLLKSMFKGKTFGPLEGAYVTKDVAEDLLNTQFFNMIGTHLMPLLDYYDKNTFRQLVKQGLTTLMPGTRLFNITYGFLIAGLAGVDPMTFARNRIKAKDELDGFSGDVEFLYLNGVLNMSNINQEFGFLGSSTEAEVIGNKGTKPWHKITRSDFLKSARESYGRADDVAKIATFKSFIEQGMSKEEALKETLLFSQDYSSVGKYYSIGSKIPILGSTFGRFIADAGLRVAPNLVAKRPATVAAYLGFLQGMGLFLSALSGEDDDRRKVRTERTGAVSMFGIPLNWIIFGKEYNIAKLATPFYTYNFSDQDEEDGGLLRKLLPINVWWGAKEEGGLKYLDVKSSDPALGFIYDALIAGEDFSNRNIANPKNSALWDDKITMRYNRAIYMLRNSVGNVVPIKLLHDIYMTQKTGMDFWGRSRTTSQVILSRLMKVETFEEPEYRRAAIRKLNELDFEISKLESRVSNLEAAAEREIKSIHMSTRLPKDKKEKRIKEIEDQLILQVEEFIVRAEKFEAEKLNFGDLQKYIDEVQ